MKICILYTSYRQFEELDYLAVLWPRLPYLSSSADVIYHCNNKNIQREELEKKLSKIPFRKLDLIYSPQKNVGGYPYGQFEAICDAWGRLQEYDWVIHLHPDVFIIDEERLLGALRKADSEQADMVVCPIFALAHPSFATDFFAFRPSAVPLSVFESYHPLESTKVVVPLENLFFIEVHRARLKYDVAHRFAHGQYNRDIDRLGLWHEHHLQRMKLYLKQGWLRWIPTMTRCATHPFGLLKCLFRWAERRLKGIRQDSLAQQLTGV